MKINRTGEPPVEELGEGQLTDFAGEVDGTGARMNKGKISFQLVPPDFYETLAEVFMHGATKYAPNNWRKGMSWGGMVDSLERHVMKWKRGEDVDADSGLHPLAHAAWNALAIVYFSQREEYQKFDDRSFKENG